MNVRRKKARIIQIGAEREHSPIINLQKLPLAKCAAILNSYGIKYSDEEVVLIRDFMYQLAAICYEQQMSNHSKESKIIPLNNQQYDNSQSNYLRAG